MNCEGGKMGRELQGQMCEWEARRLNPVEILEEHTVLMKMNKAYHEEFLRPITLPEISEEFAGHIRTLYDEKGWTGLPKHDDLVGILGHARAFQESSIHHARLSWICGEPEDESEDRSSHEWLMENMPYDHILNAVQDCQTYSRSNMEKEIERERERQQAVVPALYMDMLETYLDKDAKDPPSLLEIGLFSVAIRVRKLIPHRIMHEVFLLRSRKEIKESYATLHRIVDEVVERYTPKTESI